MTKLMYRHSPIVIRFSHEWTIEKFSSFLALNPWKWPLYSECISPPDHDQLMQLHFRLHPLSKLNYLDYMSIAIVFTRCTLQKAGDVKLQCEIQILDQNHKVCYTKKGKFKLMQNECTQTVANFIKHSDLLNSRSAYLQNDKLRLRIEIKLLARNDLYTNVQSQSYVPVGESRISEAAKVTHLKYKWTIRNCDCLFKVDDRSDGGNASEQKKLIVPLFIQSNYLSDNPQNDHHKLKLKLYPKGLNYNDSAKFVYIELCTDSLKLNFLVRAKIEIAGTGKGPQESIGLVYHGKTIRLRNYITQKDFINLIKSQSGNYFTVNCKLTYMICDETPYESVFKGDNAKNDLEDKLDAAKTLSCYTQKSSDNVEFVGWKFEQFSLETENQTLLLDAQWIKNVNWFSVRLTLKAQGCDVTVQGTIQFCVSLLDQFGQKCYTKEMQVNALSSKESFGYGKYIRTAHLAHLRSNGKQITKLLLEFWVNTKLHNSSSDNVEYIFKYPTINGSVTNFITNSIYGHNSNININGPISLILNAENSKRTPLNTVNFEK